MRSHIGVARTVPLLAALSFAFLIVPQCDAATPDAEPPAAADVATGRLVVPGVVLDALPEQPSPDARYLIYLHGAILETEGLAAVHPRFGKYEYASILDSLAIRGLVVISELRAEGADPLDYAKKMADWVNTLLRAGVPPEHITVVGFSKGGGIAMSVCERLSNERLNFVFMACCPRAMKEWPAAPYKGRILSIYEASDEFAGSCRDAILASGQEDQRDGIVFEELELSTGWEHGTFYRPRSEWIDPVVGWAMSAGD